LYAFGTPQAPPSPAGSTALNGAADQPSEAVGATSPEGAPGEDPAAPAGKAPAADPNSPLAIEIPGCVCHSDDPKIVEEHAGYRMNQCAGCHAGQVPTGQ